MVYTISALYKVQGQNMDGKDECGAFPNKVYLRHPKYLSFYERRNSFVEYPKPDLVKKLVEAGFFYSGKEDETICFLCGLGLKNWSPNEEPWIYHNRMNPKCLHVICNTETEIEKYRNQNMCKFCRIEILGILFLPCRHLISCVNCAARLIYCPLCEKKIESPVRIYF